MSSYFFSATEKNKNVVSSSDLTSDDRDVWNIGAKLHLQPPTSTRPADRARPPSPFLKVNNKLCFQ